MRVLHSVVIALAIVSTRAHLGYWDPNPLQTVQGLYVKPSTDGHTGDLYVAASEDNGVNSQWVADKPINFLSSGQPSVSYSSGYASNTAPGEETVTTQKRAIFAGPSTKLSYGVPATSDASGNTVATYPYTAPVDANSAATPYSYSLTGATATPTEGNNAPAAYPYAVPTGQAESLPQASPYGYGYQYFYPYLLSSMAAHTANALKAMGMSEDMANSVASHTSMSMWSQMASSAYGYPMQYMMPNAWAGQQNTWAQSPAALTPSVASAPTQQANTENA